ncbi:MAG: hypothetical protein IKG27_04285 [Bacilli bacterium]|nr:hypothetical protein [Bacilli bacterium]
MSISLLIFIILLVLVIVFFKNFHAFIYFVVSADIFLRLVTYLKANIIKDSAFAFLNAVPANVPEIIKSFDLGVFTEILMFLYIAIYIIFESFMIRNFIKKKF